MGKELLKWLPSPTLLVLATGVAVGAYRLLTHPVANLIWIPIILGCLLGIVADNQVSGCVDALQSRWHKRLLKKLRRYKSTTSGETRRLSEYDGE